MAAALRRQALRIFGAALKAASPREAVRRHLRVMDGTLVAGRKRYQLGNFRNIYVIGAGKASVEMAREVERLLGRRIRGGLINTKYGHGGAPLKRIEVRECGHPVPDASGQEGAAQMAAMAGRAGAGDLVLCLISGGASALLPLPVPTVTLAAKRAVTALLLECGANIHEMNCVRKHISAVKGGQLARRAYPARVLALILSDVIGDDLDVIGSGPTVPDRSTFQQARAVLQKYGIWEKIPSAVRRHLSSKAPETPKPGDPVFARVQNLLVGSNRLAVDAAAREARSLGFRTLILSTMLEGEAREIAQVHAAIAKELRSTGHPVRPPACIISGGESTVTLRGTGLGGRNQEFALAAAMQISGLPDTLILSAGTDGTDGPTDAAGAIADGTTLARAAQKGLDASAYLANNDSYHFFEALRDLLRTGPTGTNVADIQIVLVG